MKESIGNSSFGQDLSIKRSYVGNGPSGSILNHSRIRKVGFTAFTPSARVLAPKNASRPDEIRPKQPRTGQKEHQRRPLRPGSITVDQSTMLKRLEHPLLLFLEGWTYDDDVEPRNEALDL